jgi:VWFA-related protein
MIRANPASKKEGLKAAVGIGKEFRAPGLAQMFCRVSLTVVLLAGGIAARQDTTLRSQSNAVIVPALVKDAKGGVVYGLTQKDFVLFDDAAEQMVHLDDSPEAGAISLVVAIQTGRRARREFPRMRGIAAMLSPVFSQPGSRVALVEFDSQIHLANGFTSDETRMDENLNALPSGDNGAAIRDAVKFSVSLLEKEAAPRQRVLLLVSENRDQGSRVAKIDDVVAAVGNSNTVVYALAFSPSLSQVLDTERGSNHDEAYWNAPPDIIGSLRMARQSMRKNTTRAIAAMTGGEYVNFSSRKAFETQLVDFTNHLHSRYVLSFEPQRPHPGLHRIELRLRQPVNGARVLSRTGYWAADRPQ